MKEIYLYTYLLQHAGGHLPFGLLPGEEVDTVPPVRV